MHFGLLHLVFSEIVTHSNDVVRPTHYDSLRFIHWNIANDIPRAIHGEGYPANDIQRLIYSDRYTETHTWRCRSWLSGGLSGQERKSPKLHQSAPASSNDKKCSAALDAILKSYIKMESSFLATFSLSLQTASTVAWMLSAKTNQLNLNSKPAEPPANLRRTCRNGVWHSIFFQFGVFQIQSLPVRCLPVRSGSRFRLPLIKN